MSTSELLLRLTSSSVSYLKHSMTIILNGAFTGNMELGELSLRAETTKNELFSRYWQQRQQIFDSKHQIYQPAGKHQRPRYYDVMAGFLQLLCWYTTPFPRRRLLQSFTRECYESSGCWEAKQENNKCQYCILLYINKLLFQKLKWNTYAPQWNFWNSTWGFSASRSSWMTSPQTAWRGEQTLIIISSSHQAKRCVSFISKGGITANQKLSFTND